MTIVEVYEDESQSATERLLEQSWEGRERRASERELIVDATAAALFVVTAMALVLSGGLTTLRPGLAAAFAAGCIVDLTSSLVRMHLAAVVPDLRLQMRVIARVWAVDAALAPLGFLAAIATRQNELAILFVLPLVFLLSLLARDRSK